MQYKQGLHVGFKKVCHCEKCALYYQHRQRNSLQSRKIETQLLQSVEHFYA